MNDRHHLRKLTNLYEQMKGILKHGQFSIHPSDTPSPIDWHLLIEEREFNFADLILYNSRISIKGYYLENVTTTFPTFDLVNGTVVLKSHWYRVKIVKMEDD